MILLWLTLSFIDSASAQVPLSEEAPPPAESAATDAPEEGIDADEDDADQDDAPGDEAANSAEEGPPEEGDAPAGDEDTTDEGAGDEDTDDEGADDEDADENADDEGDDDEGDDDKDADDEDADDEDAEEEPADGEARGGEAPGDAEDNTGGPIEGTPGDAEGGPEEGDAGSAEGDAEPDRGEQAGDHADAHSDEHADEPTTPGEVTPGDFPGVRPGEGWILGQHGDRAFLVNPETGQVIPLTSGSEESMIDQIRDILPVPRFNRGGWKAAVGLVLGAIGVALLSILGSRVQNALPTHGLLPHSLRFVTYAGRLATVLMLLGALLVGAAGTWAGLVSYVLIGAGIALGWSARDAIRDFLAGAVLLVEAPLDVGHRVRCGDTEGTVLFLGPRVVHLLDDRGHTVTVPNRLFLEHPVAVDPTPYAPVEVQLHVPHGLKAERIHRTLTELAMLSPYLAPSNPPHVYRDPDEPDVWIVEARLVSPLYTRDFRGAMVELSEERLGDPLSKTPPPETS